MSATLFCIGFAVSFYFGWKARDKREGSEIWTIGTYTGLLFQGMGRDFTGEKSFIFIDGAPHNFFVLRKDEFFTPSLHKAKENPA